MTMTHEEREAGGPRERQKQFLEERLALAGGSPDEAGLDAAYLRLAALHAKRRQMLAQDALAQGQD